jgi:hypothetical protein
VLPALASGGFYAALVALAAVGLYLRRRRTDALSALLITTVLAVSLMHGLVEVRDRYHAYVLPLLMPIAACAIMAAVQRARRRGAGWDAQEASGAGTFTENSPTEP